MFNNALSTENFALLVKNDWFYLNSIPIANPDPDSIPNPIPIVANDKKPRT